MRTNRKRKKKRDEIDEFFDQVRKENGLPTKEEPEKKPKGVRRVRVLIIPGMEPIYPRC